MLISSFWALWIANKEKQHLQRSINLILSGKPKLPLEVDSSFPDDSKVPYITGSDLNVQLIES